jgi:hypothetical protein
MYKSLFSTILAVFLLNACAPGGRQVQEIDQKKLERGYAELDREAGFKSAESETPSTQLQGDSQPVINGGVSSTEVALPTIMVLPAETNQEANSLALIQTDPLLKASMEAINEYLTHKQYNVKSFEGQTQIDAIVQMQGEVFDQETDLSYIASLSMGADIYIKFAYTVQKDQVLASLSAYEASTGRLLGSQTSEVNNNRGNTPRALTQSAMRKAMPGLEHKMLSYWNKDAENGIQYKLIIRTEGEFNDHQIEDLHSQIITFLKQSFNKVIINVMTDKTMDIILYAAPATYGDATDVYEFLRQNLQGNYQVKSRNLTHKLIFMDLQ